MPTSPPPTFGLVSPCGWGNLGDAAIQESAIAGLRARYPGAGFVGFTLNAEDTTARHGIPAEPISGVSSSGYLVKLPPTRRSRLDRVLAGVEALPFGYRVGHSARAVAAFVRGDRWHTVHTRGFTARLSAIVVSGGGQLDDFWGGPWGHPYSLWKWSRVAAARRIPFVVLSVGAGTLSNPWSRRLIRGALRRARYRSFRDARSRDIAASLGLRAGAPPGPVVPDLAFGYEVPAPGPRPPNATLTVGVSPIAFRDPRVWPIPDDTRYERYLGVLAAFLERTAEAGRRVLLFTTDTSDERVVADLRKRVAHPAISAVPTPSLDALARVLERVDIVVASRLHGVILSHIAAVPVLALSYDWKVDRHMEDLGQGAYRVSIDDPDPRSWLEVLDHLVQERDPMTRAIVAGVARARDQVRAQFAMVLP